MSVTAGHDGRPDRALVPDARRRRRRDAVIDLVEPAGLRGNGGASFPVATTLRAVALRRRPR